MATKTTLSQGSRVVIVGDHPHATIAGRLVAYEQYGPGPPPLLWHGWRVRLDDGIECYAQPKNLRKTS